jgi:hypothetical protein
VLYFINNNNNNITKGDKMKNQVLELDLVVNFFNANSVNYKLRPTLRGRRLIALANNVYLYVDFNAEGKIINGIAKMQDGTTMPLYCKGTITAKKAFYCIKRYAKIA